MRDPANGRSRGFAFLTFEDPKVVNTVMVREHVLDGKIVGRRRSKPTKYGEFLKQKPYRLILSELYLVETML